MRPLTEAQARVAGSLLGQTRTTDIVDASVVVVARERRDQVLIMRSAVAGGRQHPPLNATGKRQNGSPPSADRRHSTSAADPAGSGHLVSLQKTPSIISRMSIQEYLVSASGQMSLPAAARHRWNLDGGGPVDVMDLGFGVLTAPRGTARTLLDDLVTREQHAEFVGSLDDDPDLATT